MCSIFCRLAMHVAPQLKSSASSLLVLRASRCGSSKDGCRHLRPYPWRCLTRTQASHLPRDRHPTTSKPSHPLRPFAWDGVPSPRAHQRTSVGGDALRSGAMPTFLPQANEGLRSQREGLLRNPRCCAPSGFFSGSTVHSSWPLKSKVRLCLLGVLLQA